jgi:glycosyltransferase involved in cell wall biosynthesis
VVDDVPLVSIGIPTYQRVAKLGRAVESALAQTHSHIEVVISDNASDDGTAELCRALADRDDRIRYVRQEPNRGPTANFNFLFEACGGDYVMMLADDDWLDPDYVSTCLARLRSDDGATLVAGQARYVRDNAFVHDGVVHEHAEDDPASRVRGYLAAVEDNGVFYGVMPREVLQRAYPLPDVLGNDWLHVARIAFQGHLHTLPATQIHRELGGTSADISSILDTFGRARWQARVPQLVIAGHVLGDVAWGHPVYRSLSPVRRLALGLQAARASMRWRALAWHLVTPSLARLGRRRRGRHVWRLYGRLTRALGAARPR